MIWRVRSKPASASEICVPIFTTCTTGATMNASIDVYIMKSPTCILWAAICRDPIYMITAPTKPIRTVDANVISEIVLKLANTLSSSRCAPLVNTPASRRSAWYPLITRTPPSVSVNRPVTSALILPRSRKIGRTVRNARCKTAPNANKTTSTTVVIVALVRKSTTVAITAVSRPPASSTKPVPIRLRTPSTSLMMRATSVPVLFAS